MRRSSEAQLVALARGILGGDTFSEVHLLLLEAWSAPAKLSPEGLHVLQDTLGKGAVLWLMRHGGWREPRTALSPAPMVFDSQTVPLMQWLMEQPLGHEVTSPLRSAPSMSIGHEVFLLATFAAVIDSAAERSFAWQLPVRASALCRIAFPVHLALASTANDFAEAPLTLDAAQEFVLAALQPALAKWWRAAERLKARLLLPADVLRSGMAQAAVLQRLFDWAQANDRRERCTFLLEATAPMLHAKTTAADFVATFDERMSLRERSAARRAAGAALDGVARLQTWDEEARTVRFIDDGYDAAQARVKTYETVFGNARFAIAQRVRDELAAL